MHQSPATRQLNRIASYIVAAILVLLPFHAVLTTWAGSNFGYLDFFRVWKELLMIPLSLFALWLLWRDRAMFKQMASSWLVRAIVAYVVLFVVFGVIAIAGQHVTAEALLYSWVINLRFVWFFLIVWIITRADPFITQQWLKLLLVPALGVVLFGLLQRFVLSPDVLRHFGYGPETIPAVQTVDNKLDYRRVQSTLRGANPLGAYLVFIITAVVASLRRKKWLSILLAASGVVLFFSYSRSAWIGLVVSLGVLGCLQLSSRRGRQVMIVSLAAALLVGAGAVWQFRNNDVLQNTLFHSDEYSQSAKSSNEARSTAVTGAVKEIVREPWGRGPGTAGPASFRNDGQARISENYYLQIGQEVGVAGVLLFAAIAVLLLKALWLRRRYVLAQVLLASFAGITVINLLSHAWADDTLSLLWWGFAGAILSLPAILRKELPHETKSKAKASQKSTPA